MINRKTIGNTLFSGQIRLRGREGTGLEAGSKTNICISKWRKTESQKKGGRSPRAKKVVETLEMLD